MRKAGRATEEPKPGQTGVMLAGISVLGEGFVEIELALSQAVMEIGM